MYQGNWTCAQCGATINQLPFEPREDRLGDLACRDCFRQSRGNGRGGGDRPQRQMVQGDWKCSSCGKPIKELPFNPDPARMDQLKCKECHQAQRAQY